MLRRRPILASLAALAAMGLVAATFMLSRRPAAPGGVTSAPVPPPPLGTFTAPPPSAQASQGLRPALIEAIGLAAACPWNYRTRLIHELSNDLTAVETEALLTAMMERCPTSLNPGTHSTYMHEIACKLQPYAAIRERFARALARDTQRDASTRDYAIQHLRQVWSRAADDSVLRASVVATFREFTRLDTAVAASSVLSLHLLGSAAELRANGDDTGAPNQAAAHSSSAAPPIPDSELAPLLAPIFATENSRANLSARLTAMRIVGERRMRAFRQPLLKALTDRSEHALLRMAAAGALGSIGDPEDLQALASLDPGDARVAAALHHALRPGRGR